MKNAPPPNIPGLAPPSVDFGALLDGRKSQLRVFELDLSAARTFASPAPTAQLLKIAGNAFFIDQGTDVGTAQVIFEGNADNTGPLINAALTVGPGFVANVQFANLWIANAAQVGKVLRIFYGVDVTFTPAISSNVTLNSSPAGYTYGASYKSATALAALTPEAVFTPAANTKGATVWACQAVTSGAGQNIGAYIAKASAPGTLIDGDPVFLANAIGAANYSVPFALANPVQIPAGKGLYYISQTAEAGPVVRFVNYTLN